MTDDTVMNELVSLWQREAEHGRDLSAAELCRDRPELATEVQRRIQAVRKVQALVGAGCKTSPEAEGKPLALIHPDLSTQQPARIGRFRVERLLGRGGFGLVYLAHDDQLERLVAIKVPHPDRYSEPGYANNYLAEARVLASLDHPHIVPVHDVGQTDDGRPYVVSKFIEGCDLADKLKQGRLLFVESAELVATVAGALHCAHKRGLVHRDVKPGNILIDQSGTAYLADFGLALKEVDFGKGGGFCGTPAYMSPEQANGEGHRVDGRSDIFSLGVVFYEVLTGRRPFRGDTMEVLIQIVTDEPKPPRQVEDAIPKELERICLKSLAKRASERYTTAKDLADDLQHFLSSSTSDERSRAPSPMIPVAAATATPAPTPPITPTPTSDSQPIRIVPKGLRSFDAHDADFFLELLPGPRDRDGLPDSIRFWKTRIEETDADNTFSVGLIYGPSGCGKSSLMKAGLLPRLSQSVLAVYVEATADETEARLLYGLRKRCPALPAHLELKETVAALRRGQGIPAGKKVLIVLDQFEQWLHAKKEEENTELVQALRQCNGARVQCVVMVRDDFWLAVSRFLRDLEIRLVEGQNSALADLFDLDHARKVLAAFGRAFGKLSENSGDLSKDQKEFLNQAVSGLAQEGKVISVRLALFAEMMKGKSWTPATLKEVGGTEGVGVTFLEETFSAATAPPEHRYHQKAARGVLRTLLPESGSDIKGHMRSYAELLVASGYASRPKDFDDLLRILDSEIRLITPTDPEGKEESSASSLQAGEKYYQLTHDYLVHSLRDWLTRKQRETRRGRAELRLAERAASWTSKPENRHLPAWWEWANIRLYTRKRDWTPQQRKMMRRAGPYHAVRGGLLAVALVLLSLGGWWTFGALEARSRVEHLLTAKTADVPDIVHGLGAYRRWADPLLREKAAQTDLDESKQLHVALALLPVDADQINPLCDRLLTASGPDAVKVIRELLHEHALDAAARFWPVVQDDREEKSRRLRAACVLALSDETDPRWAKMGDEVVRCLAGENIILLRDWSELMERVRAHLVPHQARRLAEADAGGFAAFLAMLRAYPEDAPAALHAQLDRTLPSTAKQEEKEALALQQAQAAVALLHLERAERVWPLFHQGDNPTCRTYLIHRCASLGVDPAVLANRLLGDLENDSSVRQGLLLALGEYSVDQRTEVVRGPLMERVLKDYQDHSDPAIHSAAEWLLRHWNMTDSLVKLNQELRKAGPRPVQGKLDKPRWYVNGQGQTFAMIPAPGKFEIGSLPDEKGRHTLENRRPAQIDYSFAVATKLVTVAEFKKCWPDFKYDEHYSPGKETPINLVSWYDAVKYCNWLSEQEKIPKDQWCYESNAKGEYAEGMKVKANYQTLLGYRLPREAEWEYACRAGTVTAWSHGSDEAMLGLYAWYSLNSNATMHPGGSLKPNGLGLFDMHGNAWQWCQGVSEIKMEGNKDIEDVTNNNSRVVRGGSFANDVSFVRSAVRIHYLPSNLSFHIGFRLARTLPPGSSTALPLPGAAGPKLGN